MKYRTVLEVKADTLDGVIRKVKGGRIIEIIELEYDEKTKKKGIGFTK